MIWLAFLLGAWLGFTLGFIACALCVMARRCDVPDR